MQQGEIVECWLWNAALSQDAKASVKWRLNNALLLEYVRKSPIAHHFRQTIALANCVGQEWTHVGTVGHRRLIAVVGIVFGPNERNFWIRRGGDLLMHFFYGPAHHLVARNILVGAEDIFRFVISVDVR